MINNSKITSAYKSEITEILERVSRGLSDQAISVIDPKIKDISIEINKQKDIVQEVKNENRQSLDCFNQRVAELNNSVSTIMNINREMESTIKNHLIDEIQRISNDAQFQNIKNKLLELETKQQRVLMYIIGVLILITVLIVASILKFFLIN